MVKFHHYQKLFTLEVLLNKKNFQYLLKSSFIFSLIVIFFSYLLDIYEKNH